MHDPESPYRAALNSMVDAIHVVDENLRIVLLNQVFEEWKQDAVFGLLNLNHELPGFYTHQEAALAVACANQMATAIQIAKLFDDLQRSNAALAVERALLTQRVADRTADLSAANAELARAARLKDEFLASMSHELRAPLNAILGFAEALQEQVDGPLNQRQLRSLGSIQRSGRHLLALINDIGVGFRPIRNPSQQPYPQPPANVIVAASFWMTTTRRASS